jgi:hypothetical protein
MSQKCSLSRRSLIKQAILYALSFSFTLATAKASASPFIASGAVTRATSVSVEKVRHSSHCLTIARALEQHYGLPHKLLEAIGFVESNLRPWVICVGSTGRAFKDRHAAEAYLQKIRKHPRLKRQQCYIGCMQISYRCHKQHFRSIRNLLDPFENIQYAARLLSRLHRNHGTWEQAIAAYHSVGTYAGERYCQRILARWRHISQPGALLCALQTPSTHLR